jgi:hypothetical protein
MVAKRLDAAPDVRQLRAGVDECERIAVHEVASARKEDGAALVRVPTQMVDVQVRQEDDVDVVPADAVLLEPAR